MCRSPLYTDIATLITPFRLE